MKAGQADYDAGGLPATAHADLAKQFGINKGRYFLHGGLNVDYAAMNTSRPAFANATLRKAANYAIDRPAMVRQRGYLAGHRDDQVLPPGLGGYKNFNLYPIKGSNYTKAKQLAQQAGGCKDVTVYTGSTPVGQNLAQVLKYNLSQIGCNVNVKLFQGFQIYIAAGTKGEPFDVVLAGWFADYADPYDFIDILLNGNNIHEANNNNLAYFNDASINNQMSGGERADRRQAVRRVPGARPEDQPRLRPVDGVRAAQPARVRLCSHRWVPLPGSPWPGEPQHLLPQVGEKDSIRRSGRRVSRPGARSLHDQRNPSYVRKT